MLQVSYAAAALGMITAALYLFLRLRPLLTTTTMLIISLLLIYGPAFLSFTLTSGEYAFYIRRMYGFHSGANYVWLEMATKIPDLNAVIASMNFSVALMYVGILAGTETVGWFAAKQAENHSATIANWNSSQIRDDAGDTRVLLALLLIITLFMLFVSLKENHLATIKLFFAAPTKGNDRLELRLHHSGSPDYLYNVVLGAIAPMLAIWGALAGWQRRSWPLLGATFLLLVAILIGKVETLSKAPPAFFLLQLILAAFLMRANRLTLRGSILGGTLVVIVIYLVFRFVAGRADELATLEYTYSRVFEAESETLLQYFAAFPRIHPFMWGANIRPLAALMQVPYEPSFSLVAHIWAPGSDPAYTAPSLFIADAWADFSYAGVILYSILAGAVCRSIDFIFLSRGKSVAAIAVLAATFWGVLVLLTTALNIAFLSGGLLLAPTVALLLASTGKRPTSKSESPTAVG